MDGGMHTCVHALSSKTFCGVVCIYHEAQFAVQPVQTPVFCREPPLSHSAEIHRFDMITILRDGKTLCLASVSLTWWQRDKRRWKVPQGCNGVQLCMAPGIDPVHGTVLRNRACIRARHGVVKWLVESNV